MWGCGLSLTLRDMRVLRVHLTAAPDWPSQADAYAVEYDRHYTALRDIHVMCLRLFFGVGSDVDALRERLPRIGEDPSRMIDFIGMGPEAPQDEMARRRFYGED